MAFTDLNPGDETHRYGDYIYGDAAEQVYAGDALTLNADGTFARTAANGSDVVVGYAYIDAGAGERLTVKTHGTGIARVETDAAVGGTVGTHDGTAENVDAAELSVNGDDFLVLDLEMKENPDGSGTTEYAEVLRI